MRGSPGAIEWIVFLLCASGIAFTWLALWVVFFRSGAWLFPGLAGFYLTVLETAWALGMIYGMDVDLFPPSFCRWQGVAISFGAYGMSSASCVLSLSTFLNLRSTVFKHPLDITKKLLPLFILHPVVCAIIFAFVAIRHDAIGKSWIICDAVDPPWMRLLSYAGMDWLVLVPAFVTALLAIKQLLRMRHELLDTTTVGVGTVVESAQSKPSSPTEATFAQPTLTFHPAPPAPDTNIGWPPPPYLTAPPSVSGPPSPIQRDRPLSTSSVHSWRPRNATKEEEEEVKSLAPSFLSSSAIPLVKLPPSRNPQGISQRILQYEGLDRIVWGGREIRPSEAVLASRRAEEEQRIAADLQPPANLTITVDNGGGHSSGMDDKRNTLDAIMRVALLLIITVVCQALASISPFIAVGRNRVDRGFGTQHLAGFTAGAFAWPLLISATPAFRAWIKTNWSRIWRRRGRRRSVEVPAHPHF